MPVQEITRILTSFATEDETALVNRYGEEARSIADDMARLLASRLSKDTPYVSLWEHFRADPEANAPELNGALEALVEADPGLARRLDDFLKRYRRSTMPTANRGDFIANEAQDVEEEDPESLAVTGDSRARNGDFERGAYLYGDTLSGRETVGDGIQPLDEV